jgi:hypothetical protein
MSITVIWRRFGLLPLRRGIRIFAYQSCLTTVSVSLGRVIGISLIYHAMSLTTVHVSVSRRKVIRLSQ